MRVVLLALGVVLGSVLMLSWLDGQERDKQKALCATKDATLMLTLDGRWVCATEVP